MNGPTIRTVSAFDVQGLAEIVGAKAIDRLRLLVRRIHKEFRGHNGNGGAVTVWHINSSAVGGGVADILNSLVPFSREIGLPAEWFVIGGDEKFFRVTKAFHNALQGSARETVTEEMLAHYRSVTRANADMLRRLFRERRLARPDIVVLHDPQPAGLIDFFRREFPESLFIWRGHIQFDLKSSEPSHPGLRVWEMLSGYVNQFDAAIFHLPEQAPPGLTVPVRFILPSINPLAFINRDLVNGVGGRFIDSTLSKYGLDELHDRSVPLIIQNARFDPWKDPEGVIHAFREARGSLPKNHHLPHLVLVGPLVADDPQAREILAQLELSVNGDGAVHLVPIDPTANGLTSPQASALEKMGLDPGQLLSEHLTELEINAFQTRADIVVAKSLREGFGMTVTGAGYHGKPRIVSRVGGLPAQVTDRKGNHYALLAGGSSDFSREASISMTRDWMVRLLCSPPLRRSMGTKAKRHVIQNFLPHRHLNDYLNLFLELGLARRSKIQQPFNLISPN